MMQKLSLVCGVIGAASSPPPAQDYPAVARWMVNTLDWGFLSTISTRAEGSRVGDAFGNPQSHADATTGVPYFFVSQMDSSMQDIFSSDNASTRVTYGMTEAQLTGNNTVADCNVNAETDPELPICARLVISGNLVKLDSSSDEGKSAKAALLKRHPSMRWYPPGHNFFVAKLELDGIWLLNFYGGAQSISPADYFAAKLTQFDRPMRLRTLRSRPNSGDKVATARWMATTMNYGSLATISTRSEGSTVGDAFGNPYSFADVAGTPYFWATMLDSSLVDLFGTNQSVARASFALSEAELTGTGDEVGACVIGNRMSDPENPPCARLVLSGEMSILDVNSTEGTAAKAALFARHPSFQYYPQDHMFVPVKMDVDSIWLIAAYGGASIISPADYLAGSSAIV